MSSMLKLAPRILAAFRSRRWSFGSLLASTINVAVCTVVTYIVLRSPAEGGPSVADQASTPSGVPTLEPHAWQQAVVTVAVILSALAAWTHGQKILAACLNVVAEALLESRRASGHLGMSFDRLIAAVQRFVGFRNEKKPLGRRPPPVRRRSGPRHRHRD